MVAVVATYYYLSSLLVPGFIKYGVMGPHFRRQFSPTLIYKYTDLQIQDQAGSCPQPPLTVVWAQQWTKMDISEAIFSGITYHEI